MTRRLTGWAICIHYYNITVSSPISKVHRLGQDREVFVKRLVIADTVEDRILHMQETKVRLELRG